jgi:hypothetical protein
LPSKKEDEGEGGTEGEGEGEAATPVEGESGEGGIEAEGDGVDAAKEKEAPMGGGKPFRKIHGKIYVIDGDEFVTDDDPKGDEKIDVSGNLLGGMSSTISPPLLLTPNFLVRPPFQSFNIRSPKSTPDKTVYARYRCCPYFRVPRFALLFPSQPSRIQAECNSTRERLSHRRRKTRFSSPDA